MHSMQVIGLTTTEIQQGAHAKIQYRLLTKTHGRLYDYIFTPDNYGRYTLKTSPTVENVVEMHPLTSIEMKWDGQNLVISNYTEQQILFDYKTQALSVPTQWFQEEAEMLPKRLVLIIDGHPDSILPFLTSGHSIVYADTWEHLPSLIPEDVIVLDMKHFPLDSIVMRLPQHTKAVVVHTEIKE